MEQFCKHGSYGANRIDTVYCTRVGPFLNPDLLTRAIEADVEFIKLALLEEKKKLHLFAGKIVFLDLRKYILKL